MSVLREQTEAGLAEMRRLRDTTPNLGLRIWLTNEIEKLEEYIGRCNGVLPRPMQVYRRRSMRRT
jgi:hypothetical protein